MLWRIRMRLFARVFVCRTCACSLFAQSKPSALMAGIGHHHHPITTKSPEAQRFFEQGLTLVCAFNHEEADGQAKVWHLHETVFRDHDVAGFQIAMDDPGGVGFGQSVGNLTAYATAS